MSTERLTISRRGSAARSARLVAAPVEDARKPAASEIDALAVLAVATSARLDDPRLEHERVVLVGIAIEAGRDAARVLSTWLQQSLAEHRGSRSKWDLEESTGMLRLTLARYHETLVDTAERLACFVPSVRARFPSLAAAAEEARPRRHVLQELEIASRMLAALTSSVTECGVRDGGALRRQGRL